MRISQAELPIIKGLVYRVVIKYQDLLGVGQHCTEKFDNVVIADSVLNLELGVYANCNFQEKVSQTDRLDMEVCLSGQTPNDPNMSATEVCFQEKIKVASVPAAIKVQYAVESETAHRANLAYQSHYTYRVAADHSTLGNQIYPAHFSFRSGLPTSQGAGGVQTSQDLVTLRIPNSTDRSVERGAAESGFIRWVPMSNSPDANHVYIAQAELNNGLSALNHVILGAYLVDIYGPSRSTSASAPTTNSLAETSLASTEVSLAVARDLDVSGDSQVSSGKAMVTNTTQVKAGAEIAGGMLLHGEATTQHLAATELLRTGWRRAALTAGAPTDLISLTGHLDVVGHLVLSWIGQTETLTSVTPPHPNTVDQEADITINGVSFVEGMTELIIKPTDGQMTAAVDGDDVQMSGDITLSGGLNIQEGLLDVDHKLTLRDDLITSGSLKLSNQLALTRSDGQPDVIFSLSDQGLGLNLDLTEGDPDIVYDLIRFKGEVVFHDRVDLDGPIDDVQPECSITPAIITMDDVSGDDDIDRRSLGKQIPSVFEVQCRDDDPLRVSALLDSTCGNGVREGTEICDLGENNTFAPQSFYCDENITPFPNCRFYRTIDLATLPAISCADLTSICVPTQNAPLGTSCSNSNTCDDYCQRFDVVLHQEACVAQSSSDNDQRIIDVCASTLGNYLILSKLDNDGGCTDASTPKRMNLGYPEVYCRSNCTYARCGDGIVDNIEKCDDGNIVDTDDCSNTCNINSSCRLEVLERIRQNSVVIPVSLMTPADQDLETTLKNFSPSECLQSDGSVVSQNIVENNAVQRVVELDLSLSTWVNIETFTPGIDPNNPGSTSVLPDTHLYLREQCGQVRSTICNDNAGGSLMASTGPQRLGAGRHYIVVSSHDQRQGMTNLAVKLTCAEQERLVASVIHRAHQDPQEQIIQLDTATSGRVGYVQPECLAAIPEGFKQPTDPDFDSSSATSALGLHQVAVELILETEQQVEISANSDNLDPVLYLKHGCEARSVVSLVDENNRRLCNDNATGNPRFPLALVEGKLPAGVYYIIVDSPTGTGSINLTLSITDP
jgi:cysteine-rich repeat protein